MVPEKTEKRVGVGQVRRAGGRDEAAGICIVEVEGAKGRRCSRAVAAGMLRDERVLEEGAAGIVDAISEVARDRVRVEERHPGFSVYARTDGRGVPAHGAEAEEAVEEAPIPAEGFSLSLESIEEPEDEEANAGQMFGAPPESKE